MNQLTAGVAETLREWMAQQPLRGVATMDDLTPEDREALDAATDGGKLVDEPNAAALKVLRRYPETLARAGDMAAVAERDMVLAMTGGKETVMYHAVRAQCDNLRFELGYPDAPAVERLLIDRVVLTWLRVNRLHCTVANMDGGTLAKAAHYDKALSRAGTDHARALVALAKVRRLALPAVQVNVTTGNQLNVAGSVGAGMGGNDAAGE